MNTNTEIKKTTEVIPSLTIHKQHKPAPRPRSGTPRLSIDSCYDAVILFDRQGKVTAANSRAEQLLGYPRVEICTMSIGEIIKDGGPHIIDMVMKNIDEGRNTFMDGHCTPFYGSPIPVEMAVSRKTVGQDRGPCFFIRGCHNSGNRAIGTEKLNKSSILCELILTMGAPLQAMLTQAEQDKNEHYLTPIREMLHILGIVRGEKNPNDIIQGDKECIIIAFTAERNAALLANFLKEEYPGKEIIPLQSATEVFEVFVERHPAVVIFDEELPLDGLDVTPLLLMRSHAAEHNWEAPRILRCAPIVSMAANSIPKSELRMNKPITREQLCTAIEELLQADPIMI